MSVINFFGKVKKGFGDIKDTVMQTTPIEKKVKEATANSSWGPTITIKRELAELTNNYQNFREIIDMVFKRMGEPNKNYQIIRKSLSLLQYLMLNGSENVKQEARRELYKLRELITFFHTDGNGREVGKPIRELAKDVCKLVKDDKYFKKKRGEARKNSSKYQGFSNVQAGWRSYNNTYEEEKIDNSYKEEVEEDENEEEEEEEKFGFEPTAITPSTPKEENRSFNVTGSNITIRKRKKKGKRKAGIRRPSIGEKKKPTINLQEPQKRKEEPKSEKVVDFFGFMENTPQKTQQVQNTQQQAPQNDEDWFNMGQTTKQNNTQNQQNDGDWFNMGQTQQAKPQQKTVQQNQNQNNSFFEVMKTTDDLNGAFENDEFDDFATQTKKKEVEEKEEDDPNSLLSFVKSSGFSLSGEKEPKKEEKKQANPFFRRKKTSSRSTVTFTQQNQQYGYPQRQQPFGQQPQPFGQQQMKPQQNQMNDFSKWF